MRMAQAGPRTETLRFDFALRCCRFEHHDTTVVCLPDVVVGFFCFYGAESPDHVLRSCARHEVLEEN